jgi:hypothetical protein
MGWWRIAIAWYAVMLSLSCGGNLRAQDDSRPPTPPPPTPTQGQDFPNPFRETGQRAGEGLQLVPPPREIEIGPRPRIVRPGEEGAAPPGPGDGARVNTQVDPGRLTAEEVAKGQLERGRLGDGDQDDEVFALSPSSPFYGRYGPARDATSRPQDLTGFRHGQLVMMPTAYYETRFDEDSQGGQYDFSQEGGGGLSLAYRAFSYLTIQSQASLGFVDYIENTIKDHYEINARTSFDFKNVFTKGFNISVYDNYGQTGNSYTLEDQRLIGFNEDTFQTFTLNQTFLAFSKVENNVAGINFSYLQKRWTFSASYEFQIVNYLAAAQAQSDSWVHTGRMKGAYLVSKQIQTYFELDFDHIAPRNSPNDPYGTNIWEWKGGVTTQLKPWLSLDVNVAPRLLDQLDGTPDSRELLGGFTLTWTPSRRQRFGFGLDGGVEDTLDSSQRLVGGHAEVDLQLTRKVRLFTYMSVRNLDPNAGSITHSHLYGVHLHYRVHKNLQLSAKWDRSDDWTLPPNGRSTHRDINLGFIGFEAQF